MLRGDQLSAKLTFTGIKKVERKLKKLPNKVAKKVVRKAVRETGKETILKQTKSNAKIMVGGSMGKTIAKFLKLRTPKQRKGSFRLVMDISAKGNEFFADVSKSGNRNYIPHAIEFGHDNAKPIPFMRNAFNTTKDAGVKLMQKKLLKGVIQAVKTS